MLTKSVALTSEGSPEYDTLAYTGNTYMVQPFVPPLHISIIVVHDHLLCL